MNFVTRAITYVLIFYFCSPSVGFSQEPAAAPPAVASGPPAALAPSASVPKVTVASTPEGADIEIDGSFVGNTPSSIEVTPGEYQVAVKKPGYKDWTRRLKVSGGDIKINAELEK